MNFCTKCGKKADQRDKFCTGCGAPIIGGGTTAPVAPVSAAAAVPPQNVSAQPAVPPQNVTSQTTKLKNKVCNECGQELPPSANVCTLCAAPIR